MRTGDFSVEIRDDNLVRQAQLTDDELADVLIVPQVSDVGTWQVKLPHRVKLPDGSVVRSANAAMLRTPGWGIIAAGPGGTFLSGPVTDVELEVTPDNPLGTWTIQGISDLQAVIEAVAYGDPTTYDLTTQGTASDTKTAVAETLLHWYVNRNRGPGAVIERRNTRLTMGTNLGRGPSLTKSPRFQKMLPLLTEIVREAFASDGTRLMFDVVQVDDDLEFRTWVADDRSDDIRLDVDGGSLRRIEYGYSAPTAEEVIAAGQEQGTARKMRRRTQPNAWDFHDEVFLDRRDTDDDDELDQAADAELVKGSEDLSRFRAEFADNTGLVPGVDYRPGDLITVVVPGTTADVELVVPVSATPVLINSKGVQPGIAVGSPTGTAWEDLTDARLRAFETRISVIERSL